MTPLSLSSSAFARPESSSGCDYEDDGNDEVANFHDFMKRRHLSLKEVNERSDNEAGNEWSEKRPETPPVKEVSRGLLFAVAGMRVAHADNFTQLLSVAPVAAASCSRASPVNRNTVQSSSGRAPILL